MRSLHVFIYEWKHFIRSPFKILAIILFVIAGIYGIKNGERLYKNQNAVIESINNKISEEVAKHAAYYDNEKPSPEDRKWVNLEEPGWAIWYARVFHFKNPSPAMVYSTGQAEDYGFYKRVTYVASVFDSDMTKEISNPERLQTGTLDFSFVIVFLLPILLIILFHNIGGVERENNFIKLIEIQMASSGKWMISRILFYALLIGLVLTGLILFGASKTNIFESDSSLILNVLITSVVYLLFWVIIYFILIRKGKSVMGNTLKMIGVWIIFCFIIPGTVHLYSSIKKPANLMTEVIDASRDKRDELFDKPKDSLKMALLNLYPKIENTDSFSDTNKVEMFMNESSYALVNQLKKEQISIIEKDADERNELIARSFWFNPASYFQNRLNKIAGNHYSDYKQYRQDIQSLIDLQNEVLVEDTWSELKVDKARFEEYHKVLKGG